MLESSLLYGSSTYLLVEHVEKMASSEMNDAICGQRLMINKRNFLLHIINDLCNFILLHFFVLD